MENAVIVSAVRTAVGKSGRGSLTGARPEAMAAACAVEALKRSGVSAGAVEDVILGCAFPEAEQGMNIARLVGLLAGLPNESAGFTLNRQCSSGLQSISLANDRIRLSESEVMMAGGVESMSRIPMGGNLISPDYDLVQKQPEAYMSMGLTAERVAEKYNITREEQDSFAVESHQKAAAAIKAGKFEAEIVPIKYKKSHLDSKRKLITEEFEFKVDEGVRADTTLEGLAKLKAVFKVNGTVTAGNCSQTSDGAAMTLLTSESYAQENNITPIARLIKYAVIGVPPEIMGIGPAFAIPKVLEKAGMKLEDIDLFEINEAFASQAVATVKELGIPLNKVNVNGGAIALGHPLGCTGAKLTVQLLHEMKRRGNKFGIVSMCIGGGMGAAGIFEML